MGRFLDALTAWPPRFLEESRGGFGLALFGLIALTFTASDSFAQAIDCARLQAQIASTGSGRAGQYAAAAQKQRSELDRTVAYGRQIGCDRQQFLFFGSAPPPQCPSINARIQQMQANLGQLQAASGGGRGDLVLRYNAYCRGAATQAAAQPPRQRGFFESLFGIGEPPPPQPIDPDMRQDPGPTDNAGGDDSERSPRGGSQMVCVRRCDGAFFPVNFSGRRAENLNDLCQALCPAAEMSVFTRNPSREIQSAVSTDGTPYSELPNALKYQKNFDPSCSCRAPGQSWLQALTDAERTLGRERKGDILVTPEKSDELSRPKADPKQRIKQVSVPAPKILPPPVPTVDDPTSIEATASAQVPTASKESSGIAVGDVPKEPVFNEGQGQILDENGPNGVKRRVRKVGPTL